MLCISKIGFRNMAIRRECNSKSDNNDEQDIIAIQYAIDNGISHIDTSESYSGGKSEILVGKAIKKYDRSKFF